jgi:pyridoxal phosphate enzyme (YggS family)
VKIAETLKRVLERIHRAAAKTGRNPDDIKLVAVTKTIELSGIIETINAGAHILGENRVQEAQKKIQDARFRMQDKDIEWHLIGHLQTNKAKTAVQLFDLIHSVDSTSLAEELNKQAEKIGKQQRVLVEVKLSDEPAKHGVSENGMIELLKKISDMENLKLEGLMTMPPFFDNPEDTRQYFRKLRELRDKAAAVGFNLPELSMGMSNDFEVAIEEGATMIRIGTAIFADGSSTTRRVE